MAFDKFQQRIEAKIDAIAEKLGVKLDELNLTAPQPETTELTQAEQDAINNAPATPVASPVAEEVPGSAAPAPATPAVKDASAENEPSSTRSVPRR